MSTVLRKRNAVVCTIDILTNTTYECLSNSEFDSQIEVREIHADEASAGRLARRECFMFSVEDVFANLATTNVGVHDPDVVLARAMLAKSRHQGPQAELWIAQVQQPSLPPVQFRCFKDCAATLLASVNYVLLQLF